MILFLIICCLIPLSRIFNLRPTLGAQSHWAVGFFSLPHLLWHENLVFMVSFEGPVTFIPVAECLALKMSLPDLTTFVMSLSGFETPIYAWKAISPLLIHPQSVFSTKLSIYSKYLLFTYSSSHQSIVGIPDIVVDDYGLSGWGHGMHWGPSILQRQKNIKYLLLWYKNCIESNS